jgi:hypothetical protein
MVVMGSGWLPVQACRSTGGASITLSEPELRGDEGPPPIPCVRSGLDRVARTQVKVR